MAVNINSVYQKVLALANKEQRGYITPQEFNYFADIAHLEIFENYFHDLKTAQLKITSSEDFIDDVDILREKLGVHRESLVALTFVSSNKFTLPTDVYILELIEATSGVVIEEVSFSKYKRMTLNGLTSPTSSNPVFHRADDGALLFYPTTVATDSAIPKCTYFKKPTSADWGYVVINGKALYNSATSTNFDLHESEENNLVMRILELSGITLKDQALVETALRDKVNAKAEKNN